MASKKKQRGKIRRQRKQKYAGAKGSKPVKQTLTQSLSQNNTSSMSEEMQKAWKKDQQEFDRRIELKRKQKEEQEREAERLFREKRAEQDRVDKEKADKVQMGSIILAEVEALIGMYPTPGAEFLTKLLKSEISRYGDRAVLWSLATTPEYIVELARVICIYEEDSLAVHRALENFSHAIRGALPSEEEAKELGEIMDNMTHLTKDHED